MSASRARVASVGLRRGRASAAIVAALAALAGCDGPSCGLVVVDVRSDFAPGVEVGSIGLSVTPGGAVRERAVTGTDDLLRGVRVAELEGVEAGTVRVTATLRARGGAALLSRTAQVEHGCASAIVVSITRSCAGVRCPGAGDPADATECVDRRCVPPRCDDPTCPGSACVFDADCPSTGAECVAPRCVAGSCYDVPRDERCAADEVCRAELGCVPRPPDDAGAPSLDAGSGPPDAGPPPDAGCECTPGTSDVVPCGTCQSRARSCGSTCRWSEGACLDDDGRCSREAPTCVNDHCWGWALRTAAGVECVDMARDYDPEPATLGWFHQTIFGRPGASWRKQNRQVSCPGAAWTDAEGGTIAASGEGDWSFSYGFSDCANTILGSWESRMQIVDVDGTTFLLPDAVPGRFHNSTCSADRASCAAVSSFCPTP
ncbi:MAG: hypothetical protein KF729_00265 [Sandaracinaceae bacterium]|nr:hypothetical protein [Sandaracinaceae bacterium]